MNEKANKLFAGIAIVASLIMAGAALIGFADIRRNYQPETDASETVAGKTINFGVEILDSYPTSYAVFTVPEDSTWLDAVALFPDQLNYTTNSDGSYMHLTQNSMGYIIYPYDSGSDIHAVRPTDKIIADCNYGLDW